MNPLRKLLFPPKCAACGRLLHFDGFDAEQDAVRPLCPACHRLWEGEKLQDCGICGLPVSACKCMTEDLKKAKCAEFRKLTYYVTGKSTPVQNRILFRMKNLPDRATARFLAQELQTAVVDLLREAALSPQDCVLVYIPRGRGTALQTGTDQAKQLTQALSAQVGIPILPAIVRRFGKGKPQKRLSPAQRRKNAKESFALRKQLTIDKKTVILVDDVVTTGASMSACARLLQKAGAACVFCLAVASDDCNRALPLQQPTFRI